MKIQMYVGTNEADYTDDNDADVFDQDFWLDFLRQYHEGRTHIQTPFGLAVEGYEDHDYPYFHDGYNHPYQHHHYDVPHYGYAHQNDSSEDNYYHVVPAYSTTTTHYYPDQYYAVGAV